MSRDIDPALVEKAAQAIEREYDAASKFDPRDKPAPLALAHAILAADIVQDAADVLADHGSRPWQPVDGDTRCQDCGHEYEPWLTDDRLWNSVMGDPDNPRGEGRCLCPRCFMDRARWPGVWRLTQQDTADVRREVAEETLREAQKAAEELAAEDDLFKPGATAMATVLRSWADAAAREAGGRDE